MPKIEQVEKETCMQVRKTQCNMATTSEKKVVGKLAGKWKSNGTIAEISKNNGDKRKKKSKRKRVQMS